MSSLEKGRQRPFPQCFGEINNRIMHAVLALLKISQIEELAKIEAVHGKIDSFVRDFT